MWNAKDVYYISDSTAILAEDLGRALLCQFPGISFNEEKIPFVRSPEQAQAALQKILERSGGRFPLLFCTIIDRNIREIFDSPEVEYFDILNGFLGQLEHSLEATPLREPGFSRRGKDIAKRVEAIHYTLEHDDGTRTREYHQADIILVGVSRSGKTPVSVYLATHFGLKAANFPLTSEQLDNYVLPVDIIRNRQRALGLTSSPKHLHKIREKRYKGSSYASLSTCSRELQQARQLFSQHQIRVLETEGKSIEELAVQAIQLTGIKPTKY